MVFITGDRSAHPVAAVLAVAAVLQTLPEGTEIATGELGGVEAAVRYLLPDAVVYKGTGTDLPDLDARHLQVFADVKDAILIHGDPLSSKIFKSASRVWDDDSLSLFP